MAYALFPIAGPGTLVTQMTLKRSNLAMCRFEDVRPQSTARLPEIVEERLTELGLANGTLGLVGISFRESEQFGIPWNVYQEIRERLPKLTISDESDLFFELRSVKSDDEIACLAQSAVVSDIAYVKHIESARPGMTERD